MGLDNLKDALQIGINKANEFLATDLGKQVEGAVIGAITTGGIIAAAENYFGKKKTSGRKRRSRSSRRSRGRARRSGRKLKFGSRAYRKKYLNKHRTSSHGKLKYHHHRHRPSSKKIHYTKHGQPYVIISSGKARFIKKSGARRARHIKGGYY